MSRCVIVGGGIAGSALCRALAAAGHEVDLIEAASVGAHSPPAALLHAVPGRSFDRETIEWQAFEVAARWLRTSQTPLVESKMIRPLDGTGAERLLASYERVKSSLAGYLEVSAFEDRIEYAPAFSVDMRALALEWASHAKLHITRALSVDASKRQIATGLGPIDYDYLFAATGASPWLDLPPMRTYEGDLLLSDDFELEHMISAGGHAAPRAEGGISVGATVYEDDGSVDVEAEVERLLGRVRSHLPDLPERNRFELWHGVRATVADRFPICGPLDERVFVVNSLGSRGLYWASFLAEVATAWIDGVEPPERLSLDRC